MGTTQPPREPGALRLAGSPWASARPQATLCPVGDRTLGGPAPHPAFWDCPAPPSQPSWFFSFGGWAGEASSPTSCLAPCAAATGEDHPQSGRDPPGWREKTDRAPTGSPHLHPTSHGIANSAPPKTARLPRPAPPRWAKPPATCCSRPRYLGAGTRKLPPRTTAAAPSQYTHLRPTPTARWHPWPTGTQTP